MIQRSISYQRIQGIKIPIKYEHLWMALISLTRFLSLNSNLFPRSDVIHVAQKVISFFLKKKFKFYNK